MSTFAPAAAGPHDRCRQCGVVSRTHGPEHRRGCELYAPTGCAGCGSLTHHHAPTCPERREAR
jgi:hypothetical protein